MILLAHPTANENVRQTALALAEANLLGEFWTCVNWRQGGWPDKSLGIFPRVRNELRRRAFAPSLAPFLRTHGWREWGRHLSGQLGRGRLKSASNNVFGMDAVYTALDRRVAARLSRTPEIQAVYAYEDGALQTFQAAKKRGLLCVYEYPTAYWREVREYQQQERELHPEWAPTLGALNDSAEKLARKDEEIALADVVVTASSFSAGSLARAPKLNAPARMIPYGTSSLGTNVFGEPLANRKDKLRVIFVGALSQAKGLGYLLAAVASLGEEVEFTLIGQRVSNAIPTPDVLARYRWIPSLPHDELLREMARHDVLVLTSLHEGFGLVLSEAMSCGLTIIATPHTAAPDLIADGVEGFIVPIRSSDAIEEKLALLARDRERLLEMRRSARARAATVTWENYRRAIVQMARHLMKEEATP